MPDTRALHVQVQCSAAAARNQISSSSLIGQGTLFQTPYHSTRVNGIYYDVFLLLFEKLGEMQGEQEIAQLAHSIIDQRTLVKEDSVV